MHANYREARVVLEKPENWEKSNLESEKNSYSVRTDDEPNDVSHCVLNGAGKLFSLTSVKSDSTMSSLYP